MKNTLYILYAQSVVLAGGTIFAWYQWYLEYFRSCTSCGVSNQFFSKCLLGALFFTAAFILNILLALKLQKKG